MLRVAAPVAASHMPSKFWVTCGAAAVMGRASCAQTVLLVAISSTAAARLIKVENLFIVTEFLQLIVLSYLSQN